MEKPSWNIIGEGAVATVLRDAASSVDPRQLTTLVTNAATIPAGAHSTDHAIVAADATTIIPHLLGLAAIADVANAVRAGKAGQLYGCYGSFCVVRGSEPEHVEFNALLPLLAVAIEIVSGDVTSVWARRASLLEEGDAWFVTLHCGPAIVTLEAMATVDPPATTELVLEVTGSDGLLRAEPPASWECHAGIRLLEIVNALDESPMTGSAGRLRAVWAALHESASSGSPVELS